MKYTFKDFQQAAIGSFLAVVVFFAIRGDNPFFFNPTYGMIITVAIVYIYYKGFSVTNNNTHFLINITIALVICAVMALVFGLITEEQLFTKQVFGSLVFIGWWLAIPLALIFDKFNFTNPLRRYYVRSE